MLSPESLHPLPLPILTGILPRVTHSEPGSGRALIRHLLQEPGLPPVSPEPVNHSPWPPPCSVPLMCHLALPLWVPEGTRVLTNGYRGGYRLELCPELQNSGLLTVTEKSFQG